MVDIVISLDPLREASFRQFFSVFIRICQFVIPNFSSEGSFTRRRKLEQDHNGAKEV